MPYKTIVFYQTCDRFIFDWFSRSFYLWKKVRFWRLDFGKQSWQIGPLEYFRHV